jgi:hypothetical protein
MTTTSLFKVLDYLIDGYNESTLNEANMFNSIKNVVKSFLIKNKDKISIILPKVLDYIINKPINEGYKKIIFTFILITILSLGFNISKAAEIYQEKGVYNKVDWTNISSEKLLDIKNLTIPFQLGEYNVNNIVVNEWYVSITNQLPSKPVTLKAKFVVTISKDPSNPSNKNYANDDTPEDKSKGGNLLEKRKNAANRLLNILKNKFKDDNIKFDFDIVTKIDNDRIGYFDIMEYKIISINSNSNDVDSNSYYSKHSNNIDSDSFIKPNLTGGGLDISNLSRNYQYVELLKLGNITSKRFNGDNIESGDNYSKWIVNTRKHIKDFLTKLQREYPNKGIQFDKSSKSINPISGSMAGVSNTGKQYQYVPEKYIKFFESFEKEKNPIYSKWNKILGQFFPKLSIEQAVSFDTNIDRILDYLEQMYGSSFLNFTYAKSIDIKENADLGVAKEILKQIGNKALYMMAASNFTESGNGVVFKIKGSKKCNIIKIILNDKDTYDLTFIKLTFKSRSEKETNDVYVDNLHEVIEKGTGLSLKI